MAEGQEIVYLVDERGRIAFVDGGWDDFAQGNGASELVSERIVGCSLWDSIADETTRDLYQRSVDLARLGQEVRFTFRCDSPSRRRLLEMEIGPGPVRMVRFRTRLLAQEDRDPPALWPAPEAASDEIIRMCGWCKRIVVGAEWVEVEEAQRRLNWTTGARPPLFTHTICEGCLAKVNAALAAAPPAAG